MRIEGLRHNKWFARLAWSVAVLVALWALAWLAVPPLLKSRVEQVATERLGRQVRLGRVDFRPWTLELTVSDISIAQAGSSEPQLAIKRLYIDGALTSLLRLAPVVDAVEIESPRLLLTHRGDGHYDVDDVLARLSQPGDPRGEPPKFALYNLVVTGGEMDYRDQAVGRTHELRELQLGVPFLSNLASQREVKVLPRLAFKLNGSRFDSAAEGTPFAQTRKTDATLRLAGLDLAPYLGYVPKGLPVRLMTGVLDADLRLSFEQKPAVAVKLAGTVQLSGIRVSRSGQQGLLDCDRLKVGLADVQPLQQVVRLSYVELEGPRLAVRRDSKGHLNLDLFPAPSAAAASASPGRTAWTVDLARLQVRGGAVAWRDDTFRPGADLALADLRLDAFGLVAPLDQPARFSGSAKLAGQGDLAFGGTASTHAASVTATVAALPLSVAGAYARQFIEPHVDGSLDAELGVDWTAPAPGKPQGLVVGIRKLVLDRLAASQGKVVLASIRRLELNEAQLDITGKSVSLGHLVLNQPRAAVERGDDGRWMFEKWLKLPPAAPGGAAAGPSSGWRVSARDLAIDGGQVSFKDLAAARPVAADVSGLQVRMKDFVPLAGDAKGPPARPAPVTFAARISAGRGEPGRVSFKGVLKLVPLTVQGAVDAAHVPLHALGAYFADALNLELLRADASFKGQVRYAAAPAGMALSVSGDSSLEEFRANSVPARDTATQASPQINEELLSWKALQLHGVGVEVAPGSAPRIDVRETVLSDFFARIIINENGRINLQDLVRPAPATQGSPASPEAAPVINVGPVAMIGGTVLFSDHFIRPNYSADLSELNGRLSAFSSVPANGAPVMADLELQGRAQGTAALEISGKLNPLVQPLALDIRGKVRELELPPLSPYSIKYAGYGIQRGKLSMDVRYEVLPDGQLTATNKLVLNQLTFGDKVEGAPNSLPVKLAVALLADRNGVIDVDLPISGSLNDPKFSLAPLIFKVIVNLIVKAVTAPFTLLAHALGGGGEDFSVVPFEPGAAVLSVQARQSLDKVAQALTDRPSLKLTVVGTASLEVERDAIKRDRLRQWVESEKRRSSIAAGQTATGVITVTPEEYPALLKEVYRRADMAKPRNLIGLAKDVPVAEMETRLMDEVTLNEEKVRELASQRAVAVRDYLAGRQLPTQRLFLGAAKAVGRPDKWSPSAELNLALD